jgi:hypothetical protein
MPEQRFHAEAQRRRREQQEKSITQSHRATERKEEEFMPFFLSVALWLCVSPSVLLLFS